MTGLLGSESVLSGKPENMLMDGGTWTVARTCQNLKKSRRAGKAARSMQASEGLWVNAKRRRSSNTVCDGTLKRKSMTGERLCHKSEGDFFACPN